MGVCVWDQSLYFSPVNQTQTVFWCSVLITTQFFVLNNPDAAASAHMQKKSLPVLERITAQWMFRLKERGFIIMKQVKLIGVEKLKYIYVRCHDMVYYKSL